MIITWIAIIPISYLFILIIDNFSRDHVDPIKLVIATIISASVIVIFILDPHSFEYRPFPDGTLQLTLGGFFYTAVNLTVLFQNILLFIVIFLVSKHTPKKEMSKLWWIGGVLHGFGMPFVMITGIFKVLIGITPLIGSIAFIFFAIQIKRNPKITYILPYKSYRLMVIETEGGLSLFNYVWKKSGGEDIEDFISNTIQAINIFINQSLKKGKFEELKLEDGVLILNYSKNYLLAYVLFANKTSSVLRKALTLFSNSFEVKYSSKLAAFEDTRQFNDACDLIDECFPFML